MTETTIPFQGQTAVLERPPTDLGGPVEPERGNRGKLLALVAAVALLLVGAVVYFLLLAGGDEATPAPSASSDGTAAASTEVEPPAAEKAPPHKLNGKSFGRDPFKALISEPEAAAASSADTSSTGATTATTSATTTESSTAATTTTPTTTTPSESTAHSFRVVEVAPDNGRITVKVDGQVYRNLKAGEVFAKYFKVVLISGTVNSFQYGDDKFNVVGTKKLTIA